MNAASQMNDETGAQFVRVAKPEAETLALTLTEAEFTQVETGMGDALELIRDGGEVFDFLAVALACGYLSGDDVTLGAILRQSARAMKSAQENEIKALDLVEMKLRVARLRANGGVAK